MKNFKRMKNKLYFFFIISIIFAACQNIKWNTDQKSVETVDKIWTPEQAKAWAEENGWLRGCNFTPSTAINQLEFWQAESFDPETIDRELGWAEEIGMNCMRACLHHVAWEVDKEGFKNRVDQYLDIAQSHRMKTIFVFFNDCWNSIYKAGKQPDPKPGVHNSGWIQDPGYLIHEDSTLVDELVIRSYKTEYYEKLGLVIPSDSKDSVILCGQGASQPIQIEDKLELLLDNYLHRKHGWIVFRTASSGTKRKGSA